MKIDYPFFLAIDGADSSKQETGISGSGYEMAVNVQIHEGLPTTRWGTRPMNIAVDSKVSAESAAIFKNGNGQGFMFFDPGRGQSSVQITGAKPMILFAIGGMKYAGTIVGDTISISDVTIKPTTKYSMLMYTRQGENYAFACDGVSDTWVWDSIGDPFFSNGYSTLDPANSKVPNAATAMAYSHGRMVWIINGRTVIVGDAIHKSNLTDASNILNTTEQVYWATGASFTPPSSLGDVVAAEILPLKDTQHGHGELMLHCENGIFSIDLNIHPRTAWQDTPMVKTADMDTAATGPYAIALVTGDQFFRSYHGIETLRSSSSNSTELGNPRKTITDRVSKIFDADDKSALVFASVIKIKSQDRLLSTVQPVIRNRYRWHSGIASMNIYPIPGEASNIAFEGVYTLPKANSGVIQMVTGKVLGEERAFAICNNSSESDTVNSVIEFTDSELCDTDANGDKHLIGCQLITRGSFFDSVMGFKTITSVKLYFRNVSTMFYWSLYYRTSEALNWTIMDSGEIAGGQGGFDLCGNPQPLPFSTGIVLSKPKTNIRCNWIQFMVKWNGWGQVAGIRAMAETDNADDNTYDKANLRILSTEKQGCTIFDMFEYSKGAT